MKTPREIVLEYYPDAIPVLSGTSGKYYVIESNGFYLGKGKSRKNAWKAASRNLDS